MAVMKHPCGCIFDDEFVELAHSDEGGNTHKPKGLKAADPEEFQPNETKESIVAKVDKILSRKKGK